MRFFLPFIGYLLSLPAAAADTVVAAGERPDPFSSAALLQVLLGLLFVIALILVLAWFARRTMGVPVAGQHMKVIAGVSLGTRERAVLVQVGQEQLLLGVAPGRVTLLSRFEEPVVDASLPEGRFGRQVMEALQRRSGT